MTNKTSRPLPLRFVALLATLVALAFAGTIAAQPAAAVPPPEFYGLNVSAAGSDSISDWDRIDSSGAKTVRVEFNWKRDFYGNGTAVSCPSSPLPASGFNTVAADRQVRLAAMRGITILPYLTGSFCSQGYPQPGSAEMTAWEGFAEDLADRYGPGGTFWAGDWDNTPSTYTPVPIERWEVGNEPNLAENNPGGTLDPQKYGKFLIETSAAIKTSQSGADVLMGGLYVNSDIYTFLDDMYDPDPSSLCCAYTATDLNAAYDAVSLHPYDVTGYDDDVESLILQSRIILNVVTNPYGPQKPISITEFGWPVGNDLISECSSTATADHIAFGQSKNLYDTYTWLTANAATYGLDLGSWNSENDTDARCGSGGSVAPGNSGKIYSKGKMGLWKDYKWSKRPAFCNYVKFTGAPACATGIGLSSSPAMDQDPSTGQLVAAYVNYPGGISYYEYRSSTGFAGEDLSVSGATQGSTPGVSLDPTTGQTRIFYRTDTGKIGLYKRANWTAAWTGPTFYGVNGEIEAGTSPGVHRSGTSGANNLITDVFYKTTGGGLKQLTETAIGWYGPAAVTSSPSNPNPSTNTTPSVVRDPASGNLRIAYRNVNGAVGTTTWDSFFGWQTGTASSNSVVDAGSSVSLDRDPSNSKTVIAYRNTADQLAARTLMPGAWVFGGTSSGTAMSPNSNPSVSFDDVLSEATVAFTNGSSGISTWHMNTGGTWGSTAVAPGYVAGGDTEPVVNINRDASSSPSTMIAYNDGQYDPFSQQLGFGQEVGGSWSSPIIP